MLNHVLITTMSVDTVSREMKSVTTQKLWNYKPGLGIPNNVDPPVLFVLQTLPERMGSNIGTKHYTLPLSSNKQRLSRKLRNNLARNYHKEMKYHIDSLDDRGLVSIAIATSKSCMHTHHTTNKSTPPHTRSEFCTLFAFHSHCEIQYPPSSSRKYHYW